MSAPNPESPRDDEDKKKHVKTDFASTLQNSSTRDIIAYVLMIIGIVFLFTFPFVGGLIVGFIFAIYFYQEISHFFQNINELIDVHGMVKSLLFGGLLLAFFISNPAIFIGIILALAAKQIIGPEPTNRP